jgi:uncharacterized protein YjbI with pentapeptide repeats
MKAKELLSRYRQGERNFREVDLSGESLRGANLAGINLSGANLNKSDLRGTNFTRATLIGTQFCEASMGTQRRWAALVLLLSLLLLALTGWLLVAGVSIFVVSIVQPSAIPFNSSNNLVNTVVGISGLGVIAIALYLNYRKGVLATLGAFAFANFIFVFVSVISAATDIPELATTSTNFIVTSIGIVGASAIVGAISVAVATAVAIAVAVCGAVTFAFTLSQGNFTAPLIAGLINVIVLFVTFLNLVISRRAFSGDPRDKLIRDVAVGLSAIGGTRFKGANLTDANLSYATVKNTHFESAQLIRTNFHLSKQLHLSRVYKTILANRTALNLLVSHRPQPGKSYIGLNLKGANLSGAALADINFTEADLSDATLQSADMQRANLTKLQALGTNFDQANLTAACLEAWNINSRTQLEGAICEHVYLLQNEQERRPSSGDFAQGEFAKLFEEVLNTIDLIFRDGIDWQAFLQTFQTIQVQHEGAELEIQSIENKGDGVMVVRLNANPKADKAAIHSSFNQGYQKALKESEQKYEILLQSKDQYIKHTEEIINLYRQQNADMTRITESLAQQRSITSITVEVPVEATAVASSEAMQGNDQSPTYGDINIQSPQSAINIGIGPMNSEVNNPINQPADSNTQTQLKDLLTQLQAAIATEPALSEQDKAEALAEVKTIAEAGLSATEGKSQTLAKRSMRVLQGIVSGLNETTKLVEVFNRLLPAIGWLFGCEWFG